MLPLLKDLIKNTSTAVLSQRIKSTQPDLYNWILAESTLLIDVTFKERIYYVLNDKPNPHCEQGNKRTLSPTRNEYGFCGNIAKCECFRQHQIDNYKPRDMTQAIEKRKITWQKKYGVDNPAKHDLIQQRRTATIKQNSYQAMYKRLQHQKQDIGYDQVIARVGNSVTPEFTKDEYHGCFRKNFYSWKCIDCGNVFTDHVDNGRTPNCKVCHPNTSSKAEHEIAEYITLLGFQIERNTKQILGNLEYDIYVPAKQIAIEYNGIYWHSAAHKSNDYHVTKYTRSKEKGIHLIQIFEDEWEHKKDIVKSRLASVLGVSQRVYARSCEVINLTAEQYREFITSHHLQGYAAATLKLGLIKDGNILAVMSFSKSRYTKSGYELIRYCSIHSVVGGASKLFKHFIKTYSPDQIISYANRCWSNGNLYRKLGFDDVTVNQLNVGYWYVKGTMRYHRSTFTKKRLVNMGYSAKLTESKIMDSLGYLKIYDCGNYKFEWRS